MEERYLALLKRSLTGALQEDIVEPVSGRRRRFRPILRVLKRQNLVLARRRRIEPDYIEEGRPVGPLVGETMIGRHRLDHLQWCVEDVVARDVPGDLIEAGVWKGGSVILMRAVLTVLDSNKRVYVADSFQGLPPPTHPVDDPEVFKRFADLSISRRDVEAAFRRYGLLDDQVRFVEGWFSEALPIVSDRAWAVIRIDADMYESTMDALTRLYPNLSPGGYLVVDDYGNLAPCRRAVDDYRAANHITETIQEIDWTGVFWQRRDGSNLSEDRATLASESSGEGVRRPLTRGVGSKGNVPSAGCSRSSANHSRC
jgi:O-methyltransferase